MSVDSKNQNIFVEETSESTDKCKNKWLSLSLSIRDKLSCTQDLTYRKKFYDLFVYEYNNISSLYYYDELQNRRNKKGLHFISIKYCFTYIIN